MIPWVSRLFRAAPDVHAPVPDARARDGIVEFDGATLDLREGARWVERIPHPDLQQAREWAWSFGEARHGAACDAVMREWLGWLAPHLGQAYRVHESDDAFLLTLRPMRAVKVALDHLALTQRRVARSLGGLAQGRYADKQVVLLIQGEDDYYRYLSGMYPEEGEFPMSAGVHFNGPAPHFVVNGDDFEKVQPTIVHEMTHAFLAHLPIPAWLNEGLAVNMEHAFGRVADAHELIALERKQRAFWTPELIQDFWSGASYHRADEGHALSYDLGRVLVTGLASDWPRFEPFARDASLTDAGAASASRHLGIDLGEFVRHYLQREQGDWAPDPSCWQQAPERGAF